jgi:hypothetical protein
LNRERGEEGGEVALCFGECFFTYHFFTLKKKGSTCDEARAIYFFKKKGFLKNKNTEFVFFFYSFF